MKNWIKINNENDLPSDVNAVYITCDINAKLIMYRPKKAETVKRVWLSGEATHYKQTVLENLPNE